MKCRTACREAITEEHEQRTSEIAHQLGDFASHRGGVLVLENTSVPINTYQWRYCPFCRTETHLESGALSRELQKLVAQNVEKGYSWAQLLLAMDHLGLAQGAEIERNNLILGGGRNSTRGNELLHLSADQGHPLALHMLGMAYYHGSHGIHKSVAKATSLLDEAVQGGNALSGLALYNICGEQGDNEMAFSYMEVSSKLGAGVASAFIGIAYEEGSHGMKKDINKAFEYFKLGAEQGHDVAQFFAARLCRELLNDEEEEIGYLKMAADQGYTDAECLLGIHYVGHGGDWIKGKTWSEGVQLLRRARASGCKRAAGCLTRIEEDTAGVCFQCGKSCLGKTLQRCAKCRAVNYCSKKCQIAAWRAGHKDSCVKHDE